MKFFLFEALLIILKANETCLFRCDFLSIRNKRVFKTMFGIEKILREDVKNNIKKVTQNLLHRD